MLLGQVSWLDILVFLCFLAFRILQDVGFYEGITHAIRALPFLLFELPRQLIRERYLTPVKYRTPFAQRSTLFQDLVIKCVRYSFLKIPAKVGRVFLSKGVALPFLKFRMMRHGYIGRLKNKPKWREICLTNFRGLWIIEDEERKPDLVLYYCHGGGFAMGSSYFYLEFLMAWVSILKDFGFENPAILVLEYTLVPDKTYPYQLNETIAGYNYVLSVTGDPNQVVVAGDSAGGTLILSFLLYIANICPEKKPALATLISPWTNLVSKSNRNTISDYLDAEVLNNYGLQYAGSESVWNALVSPGSCMDTDRWQRGMPTKGMRFYYGSEEVFCDDIRTLANRLGKVGRVDCHEDESVHAWPVVVLFLGSCAEERQKGLRIISRDIATEFLGEKPCWRQGG